MKNTKTTKRKSSAAKKLVPATGMLLVSALMLTTSTYAWFTMSREVEVTGIRMTATVPESIQISLGAGTNSSTGVTMTIDDTTNKLTAVSVPVADTEWTNSVAISEYYKFGKLTPATSANGSDVYYTSDATGVGKTLSGHTITSSGVMGGGTADAGFTKADVADALGIGNAATWVQNISNRAADVTPLDSTTNGYYVDIPVWFRTSISGGATLTVQATFSDGTNGKTNTDGTRLYKAARVSVLQGNNSTTTSNALTQAVLKDSGANYYRTSNGATRGSAAGYTINAANTKGTAIPNASWAKVACIDQFNGTYDSTETNKAGNGNAVVTIPAPTGDDPWSSMTGAPYTIRVWLDGEDVDCWDANAAQDFGISLKFVQLTSTASSNTTAKDSVGANFS